MKINKKAFTLVELLVVVLIIGILAAIAVPQYQKAVMKANLHKGVSLVESLYQAQQAYALTHGDFATDIDELDLTIPKDSSCVKTQKSNISFYHCDFGRIGFWDNFANVQFQPRHPGQTRSEVAYLRMLKDNDNTGYDIFFKEGKRYCFADSAVAGKVCKELGGEKIHDGNSSWKFGYYKLKLK